MALLVPGQAAAPLTYPPAPTRLARALLAVAIVLLGVYGAMFLYHAVHQSFAPAEIHYAESTWFFAALRVRHGLPIYFDYSHAPYIGMIYPPLAPGVSGLLGALLGVTDSGMVPFTRLVSLAATLLSAAGVYAVCRRLRVSVLPSSIAALLLLTPSDTYKLWGFVARSDMLAVALGLWSVYFVLGAARDGDTPARRAAAAAPALGGLLAGLALTAKQTELAPLVAALLWLWPQKRLLLTYLLGAFVGVVLPLAPLGIEGNRLLLRAMLDLSAQPVLDDALYGRLRDLLGLFGPVIPIAMAGLMRTRTPSVARAFLLCFLPLVALVFLLTAGKVGSASQYTLDLIAALAVLAGVGLQWLFELERLPREAALAFVALLVAPVAVQAIYALNNSQDWRSAGPDESAVAGLAAVRQGPVLSEDGYVALRGADPPVMLDPYYFSVLETLGRWEAAPLAKRVQNKEFSAVVLSRPVETPFVYQGVRWIPPEVLDAVSRNYKLLTQSGRLYVYTPKP